MMKQLMMALILMAPRVFGYDISYLHGIDRDLYIIDSNVDGKTSLVSLLDGDDSALVLIHRPNLVDIIKDNPYGKETFVFIKGFDALNKYDMNKDGVINKDDMAYANLALFNFNNKTGKVSLTPLKELQVIILLQPFGSKRPVMLDRTNRIYSIDHLLTKTGWVPKQK